MGRQRKFAVMPMREFTSRESKGTNAGLSRRMSAAYNAPEEKSG
jgi:hypothetical protein